MQVVVIGGTGHIGGFLVPRLLHAGHDVICVSRGIHAPRTLSDLWRQVRYVELERQQQECLGTFGEEIAKLNADIVVDLTCYKLNSAQQLVKALRGRVKHLLHCGTIWVHGHSAQVPTTEDTPRVPFGEYGKDKAAIESFLMVESETVGLPVTILHPGHLVGPGWAPINPCGNFNLQVFFRLAHGLEIQIPNLGMETVHHVHVDDVAQAFVKAIDCGHRAIGQSFHVVSASALTLGGYAERMAEWFGMPLQVKFLPWKEWERTVSPKDAAITRDHIMHSPNCSIEKARRMLGYEPAYSSLEAVQESVRWLQENNKLQGD